VTPAAEVLAGWVAGLRPADIPAEVRESARLRVLDTLGICVAGRDSDAGRAARAVVAEWGGAGAAGLVGERSGAPAASAALVNGTYAHSLDFDDTHLPTVVHPSAPMVPALLAAGQTAAASGADLVAALVAAYEVNARLSLAQYDPERRESVFFARGLHATSIIGTVAGAAGAARLRGLDAGGIADAMAIACSMGAGIIESNRTGGNVKKLHGGWAAHGAVAAASFAGHGGTGPRTVLEGRFGFFPAFCGERWRPAELTAGLGSRWETPGIFFKPYPCNHFTHAVADAALALRARGVRPEDVAHARIGTAAASWRTIGDPIEEKRHPRSGYHGAFSAPWVFACAMAGGGGLGLSRADFDDVHLADPVRRRLAEACDVVVDERCTAIFPEQFPAVVTVRLRDGSQQHAEVLTNLGGPERPLAREQLVAKLRANAGVCAGGIARTCLALEELPDLAPLLEATVVPAREGAA
jgi:2-methylcitrate dehydratase PrpD